MSNGFPVVTLGELLVPISRPEPIVLEKRYSILGAHWYAKGLYIKEVKLGSEIRADKVYCVEEGDFVYNRLFAWKGSFAIASEEDQDCYVSNEFPCFKVKQDKIDGQYLWKYFSRSSAWNEALGLSSGGTPTSRNRLKEERLLKIKIPLPSLEEQRRIVARIEELAAKIEEARGLRKHSMNNVSHLLETAMRSLFDFNEARRKVGDFVSVLGGFAFPSEQYSENGSHQIVRIGNIRDGYLDLSRAPVRWDLKNDSRIAKYELTEGDILISMTGTRNKRDYGYIAIVPKGQKLLLNQRVGKFILHTSVNRRYLAYFLRSPFFRDHLFPNATGTANQANIGNKHIEGVPFDPPSSVHIQHSIVAYLDELEAKVSLLLQLQSETSAELNALLPSILDKAFKGEL